MDKGKTFTKWISIGWWISFGFLIGQIIIISLFDLPATPIFGLILFASFVILSFSAYYDKEYEFSPYRGLKRLLSKKVRRN